MGGQQPLVGAHVYLFAANTAGYGGPGIAASTSNASVSRLISVNGVTTQDTTVSDPTYLDYYVTSGAGGAFSISSDYTCTPGTQIYIYAIGGNAGSGTNPSAGLMAALGACPSTGNFLTATNPITYIVVNEVSTVAAAYAFAGFASDALHVSSSGTPLAQTGIANAFANAANLETIGTGAALATTGNVTAPQSEINTLGNILGACVNSNGAVTGPTNPTACYTLFTNALSAGATGAQPTDTATAAINIAHNPSANISSLFALAAATPPFAPALTSVPNDFTVALYIAGTGLTGPANLAFDAQGNAWVTNYYASGNRVTEVSPAGAFLSGSTGITGGCLNAPNGVAVDTSGNAWIANSTGNCITEISPSRTILSGSGYTDGSLNGSGYLAIDVSGNVWVTNFTGASVTVFSKAGSYTTGTRNFTSGGFAWPYGIAFDGTGNAWIANYQIATVTELSSSGTVLSGSGYTGGGINAAPIVVLDSGGNAWVANFGTSSATSSVTKLSNAGVPLSGSSGYTTGGISRPYQVALDGAGNAWTANYANSSASEISNAGTVLSPSTGFQGGHIYGPQAVAVDGSGNVWIANSINAPDNGSLTEFIGAGIPVITPTVAGLPSTPTLNGSSNQGTRP